MLSSQPPLTGGAPVTSTGGAVASGRISFLHGMPGPCYALDTACSSALCAWHVASRSVCARESASALSMSVCISLRAAISQPRARRWRVPTRSLQDPRCERQRLREERVVHSCGGRERAVCWEHSSGGLVGEPGRAPEHPACAQRSLAAAGDRFVAVQRGRRCGTSNGSLVAPLPLDAVGVSSHAHVSVEGRSLRLTSTGALSSSTHAASSVVRVLPGVVSHCVKPTCHQDTDPRSRAQRARRGKKEHALGKCSGCERSSSWFRAHPSTIQWIKLSESSRALWE